MYIHIGEDHMVRVREIIAIIDKDSAASGVQETADAINLSKGPFKSVVITEKNVYLSPLSSTTLKKRSAQSGIQVL
ncbi:extracellular matrix regulator RemB [Bacillus sp. B-jedd]|uniref:extracellular matrix regulator RemB n=1 Tax=Bacillus sp. B-jedd TaxID=1476857 RepID=UPI0005157119|nr:extracellular matrix/biofilm biosynthesis regulator RemA family protein [Bacillus sp. B-jedd]CEG29496.1 YaaB [Bacillus sp. B-jedd]